MPEIVYTVKVVLDPSSEKIVGKAIDEGLEKGLRDAQKEIEKATGKQVNFNSTIEDGNDAIEERNNLLKANVTNVESANAKARNYDNTLKRLITDEKTDIATLKEKAEQHKRFIPVLEQSVAEMRAYGSATEMSEEESIRYNRTLAKSEQTLRTMMSTNINLSNSLNQSAGEMGDVTGQAGRFNKTMSGANQTIFAFSDLVQDSTQFMVGGRFNFATGMRAIGNNVGFAAELFGNLQQNVQRYNQAIADGTIKNGQQTTTLQALSKSFTGAGGIILGVNFAVTAITLLSNAFAKNRKEAEETKNAISDLSDELLSFADTNDLNTRSLLNSISRQNELATSFERYSKTLSEGGFFDLATVYYEQAQALREESKVQQERADELLRILQIQSGLSEQTIKNRLANLDLNESRIDALEIQEKTLELFLKQDGVAGVLGGTLDRLLDVQRGIVKVERANLRSKLNIGLITQKEFDNQSRILDQRLLQLKIEEDIAKARAQQEIFGETDADRVVDEFEATMKKRVTAIDPSGFLPDLDFTIDVPALDIIGEDELLKSQAKEQQDALTQTMKDGVDSRLNEINKEIDASKKAAKEVALAEKNKLASRELAIQGAQAASQLLQSVFGESKEIAIAEALISTYFAAQKAYESQFLPVPTLDSPARGGIAAAVAVAQGLARVAAIKSTNIGSGGGSAAAGGGGAIGGGGSAVSPVSSTPTGLQPTQQINFLPNAASSGQAPPTIDVKIDRAGLAVAVGKGGREIGNKQVRV